MSTHLTVKDLSANPRNPRKISKERMAMLKKSVDEFGDLSGIIFNRTTKRLAGGHQRIKLLPADAAIEIDTTYKKPTRTGTVAEGTITFNGEKFKYREVEWGAVREETANIAANQHGGEWDLGKLSEILLSLEEAQIDTDLLGMTKEEMEKFIDRLPVQGETDEDAVPTTPDKPNAKLGDIYRLGEHRVMCGDSTSLKAIEALMAGDKADLVWTDPPYNVALGMETPAQAKKRNRRTDGKIVMNDKMSDSSFRTFLTDAFKAMFAVAKPGAGIYVAHADSEGYNFRGAMIDSGWLVKQCLIWVKQSIVMGRQDYHWQHEPILYGWSSGGSHSWYGDRKGSTVWNFSKPAKNPDHPTMKPVELIERALSNSTAGHDIVLDSFGGSGSTLIACEKLGRRARLMELDPRYVDVIIKRWEEFSGGKAKRIDA